MTKTFDPKVYELAALFLMDEPKLNGEAARVTLAAAIQEAIEDELFFMRDTMEAKR
jgi:hypothetical protein